MNKLILELGATLKPEQTHLIALHKTKSDELLLTIQLASDTAAAVSIPPVQFQGTIEELAAQADDGLLAYAEKATQSINDAAAALATIEKETSEKLAAARTSAATRTKHIPPAKTAAIALVVAPDNAVTTITLRGSTKASNTTTGSKTVDGLAIGTYDVVTTAEGYDSLTAVVVLPKADQTVTHTATLAPATPSLFA